MTEHTGLQQLFRDVFACLGVAALWRHRGQETPVRLLLRQPEQWASAGEGTILASQLDAEVGLLEVPEISVGDTFVVQDHRYRVFQEPLKDPSGTVWHVTGMIVESVL